MAVFERAENFVFGDLLRAGFHHARCPVRVAATMMFSLEARVCS